MVRDHIVFGTNSPAVREKLINKVSDLTLDIAVDIATTHKLSQSQLRAMGNEKVEVHGVTPKHRGRANHSNCNKTERSRRHGPCPNCGSVHDKTSTCPAKGKKFNFCHKYNHFAKVCRAKVGKKVHTTVAADSKDSPTDLESKFFMEMVERDRPQQMPDQVFINIGAKSVKFKLDTGAQVNIMPMNHFQNQFPNVKLLTTDHKLYGYSGKPLDVLQVTKLN